MAYLERFVAFGLLGWIAGSAMSGCSSTKDASSDDGRPTSKNADTSHDPEGNSNGAGGSNNGGFAQGSTTIGSGTGESASSGSAGAGPVASGTGDGAGSSAIAPGAPADRGVSVDLGANPGQSTIGAGEWDDNADYREFLNYLKTSEALRYSPLDVTHRQFIAVTDASGHAIANCPLTLSDGVHTASAKTLASGRTPVFPNAVGLGGTAVAVQASCVEGSAEGALSLAGDDNVLVLKLAQERTPPATKTVDLGFVLDTTGSMSEEIEAIKSTVSAVADKLGPQQGIALRIGLIAYKDYGDPWVTKTFPFTTDFASFHSSIVSLSAGGGGDIPEAVNEALHVTGQLDWNDAAMLRVAFLIADAPPHLHEQYDYATEATSFLSRGIQVFTVSASGQDALGQVVFRQVAQYTYATNMFVLRGGAGPESTGGGDPKTSCGTTVTSYKSGNLDELITQKVLDELELYDANPTDIPGLHQDARNVGCEDGGAAAEGGLADAGDAGSASRD